VTARHAFCAANVAFTKSKPANFARASASASIAVWRRFCAAAERRSVVVLPWAAYASPASLSASFVHRR